MYKLSEPRPVNNQMRPQCWSKSYLVDGGLEGGHGLECGEEEEEGEGDEDDVLHDAPLLRPQLLLAQVHPPHDRLVAAVVGGLPGRHSTHLQFHENVLNMS